MNTTIELTPTEKRRLVKLLNEKYMATINLFEVAEIKSILIKLGEEVKDWIPPLDELKHLTNQENVV